MKTINLFAAMSAAAVVCLSSCNKDSANNEETAPGVLKLELVATADRPATKANAKPNANNVVAALDVKSYNARTGEVAFNGKLPDNIGEFKDDGYKVNVYNGDAHLFTVNFVSSLFSWQHNEAVLYHALIDGNGTEKDKWYILSGYPQGKVLNSEAITDRGQQEAFKKMEAGWNTFVGALKKSGKYIN